jgi:poly-gamma-glutamate capsule biosynthesis protein CapA/YwtB (metallophosphatase superfamily)
MLGRGVASSLASGIDLFSGIRGPEGNFLRGYDGIIVNLEGALAGPDCTLIDDDLLIQPESLSLLTKENISHVGIANNHFQKCQTTEAIAIVTKAGLQTLNPSSPTKIKGTDLEIAILSIYAAPVPADITKIVETVQQASQVGDKLLVNIHWGVEYNTEPTKAQKELAYAMIEAGADVIIGHHPHVIQPIEVYQEGIIVYSLGNFLADQTGDLTKQGLAAGIFFGQAETKLFLFPFAQVAGVPTHLTQARAGEVCKEIVLSGNESSPHSCIVEVF